MKPSSAEEVLKLRTEELALKTEELKQASNSLLASNDALKLRTEELTNAHADLFESNHQLASLNKELATTNRRFAETNRRFAQMIDELSASNKELASVNKKLALANEQIKAHEGMSKDFINIAAHEIRTPTQSILGYSELLQILFEEEQGDKQAIEAEDNSKELDNQKKEALEAIDRNANRLQKLAKDILDITKIESNTLRLDKERFSLTKQIRGVIEDIVANQMRKDTISDNKNIKIKFEPKEGERGNDIFIDADKARIYQVISNLLKNAIKFVKEDGAITITVDVMKVDGERGEEVVLVKVKDTGSGIDANILPRLFTKFATSSFHGIGLGLYISKNIIEAHRGRIWAENNPDGKGATFAFSLPCRTN
jgi:signal transduction histidine kinase